jgi:hypothetical protein
MGRLSDSLSEPQKQKMGSNGPFPYLADVPPHAALSGAHGCRSSQARRIRAPNKKASRGGFLASRKIW